MESPLQRAMRPRMPRRAVAGRLCAAVRLPGRHISSGVLCPGLRQSRQQVAHSNPEEMQSPWTPETLPEFDDLVLDDKFYEEIGEDRKQLEEFPPWAPEATDPQGYNLSFEKYLDTRKDIPDYIKSDLMDAQYFGPPVLVVAGFHLEELPMMRAFVDKILGKDVKFLPVFGNEVLNMTVEEVLQLPEPDWEAPRPDDWTRGGTWGSQRTIVFGGLPMESQAAIVEVIEESGLPPVCCTIASAETKGMKLGELLADAIKLQRDRKNPEKNVWEEDDMMVDDVSDLEGFYKDKLMERIRTVQDGLQTGKAELQEDEKTGMLKVKMDGMQEEIFDATKISRPVNDPRTPKAASAPQTPETETVVEPEVASERRDVEWDEEQDEILKRVVDVELDPTERPDATDLSDFFAVDDVVSGALGFEPSKPATEPPPVSPPPPAFAEETDSGTVHELSTEPEEIEEGVSRSTVFSGMVSDVDQFMKDNFDYDTRKGGLDPPSQESTEVVDVTSVSEQEAVEFGQLNLPDDDAASLDDDLSLQDVLQSAIQKGIDPAELQRLIDGLAAAKAAKPPSLKSRLRDRLREGRLRRER